MTWTPFDDWSYSYLLGLYLGDGCVVRHERAERLVITLDGIYPEIIEEAVTAVCEYCERLGVRWTQSNHRNISVSHRDSVAILDAFIGPKR